MFHLFHVSGVFLSMAPISLETVGPQGPEAGQEMWLTSLVAGGDRVPGLFPWRALLVVGLEGLQVRCEDQISGGDTHMGH